MVPTRCDRCHQPFKAGDLVTVTFPSAGRPSHTYHSDERSCVSDDHWCHHESGAKSWPQFCYDPAVITFDELPLCDVHFLWQVERTVSMLQDLGMM